MIRRLKLKNIPEFIPEDVNFMNTCRTIGFFSLNSGEGTTTATISFAKDSAKKQRKKILLIDGNFNRPALHKIFNIGTKPGLIDILINPDLSIADTTHALPMGIDVMPIGTQLIDWINETESIKLQSIVQQLHQIYDILIIDMIPINKISFIGNIATLFDAMIMILTCERTSWEKAQHAKKKVESAGGVISGAILNKRKYYIPKCIYHMM